MTDRPYRTIFPLNMSDVERKVADEARVRDDHLVTMAIGIFVGSTLSSAMMLLGKWVLA